MLFVGVPFIGKLFKQRQVASTVPVAEIFHNRLRAQYDAARTTIENERHWANADHLGPNAVATYGVRQRIWSRARYEANQANSFAKGMILTKTNDIVGTGPRIQIETGNSKANRKLEALITEWMEEIKLAKKIWTGRNAITTDGAVIYQTFINPKLKTRVKLDIAVIECDRLMGRLEKLQAKDYVEGIQFDQYDNPISYDLLKGHPGENDPFLMGTEFLPSIDAEFIMHMFREDRPGQKHGVSEIVTALPLYAQLRRYTLATISAAETAADVAAIMHSNASLNGDEIAECVPLDALEIEMRSILTLPKGWDISQIKAEQPTTSYVEFRNAILNEAARCINMPFNIAAGNSSSYNYASGRLDHQGYFKSTRLDQVDTVRTLLRPFIRMWLDNAVFEDQIPAGLKPFNEWKITWHWDGNEHVDPQKEAKAEETKLKNGATSYADVYGKQGKDWETQFEQIAKERKMLKDLGIQVGDTNGDQAEEDSPETEEEEEPANA